MRDYPVDVEVGESRNEEELRDSNEKECDELHAEGCFERSEVRCRVADRGKKKRFANCWESA